MGPFSSASAHAEGYGADGAAGCPETLFGPKSLVWASHEGSSSPPREPKPNFLFEACSARTTSRVVANSSPRQTHERRVLHEGASFAFARGDFEGWCKAGDPSVRARLKVPDQRIDLLGGRKRIKEIDADLTLLHRTASGR